MKVSIFFFPANLFAFPAPGLFRLPGPKCTPRSPGGARRRIYPAKILVFSGNSLHIMNTLIAVSKLSETGEQRGVHGEDS